MGNGQEEAITLENYNSHKVNYNATTSLQARILRI